jgi:hypothetical protein
VTPSGTIYVLEGAADRLVRISADGERKAAGGFGWGEDGFDRPADVAALGDLEIFVADHGNDRIVRLDRTLGLASVFETRSENVTFRFPLSVALTAFGKLLVVDGEFGRVVEIGKDDRVSGVFGSPGTGRGFLHRPAKIRTDGSSRVMVGDDSGIVIFDIYGNHIRTLRRETAANPIAFDAGPGGLILLDTMSVRACTEAGEVLWREELPGTGEGGSRVPVDLRYGGRWVYVLYPDRVVRLSVPAGDG